MDNYTFDSESPRGASDSVSSDEAPHGTISDLAQDDSLCTRVVQYVNPADLFLDRASVAPEITTECNRVLDYDDDLAHAFDNEPQSLAGPSSSPRQGLMSESGATSPAEARSVSLLPQVDAPSETGEMSDAEIVDTDDEERATPTPEPIIAPASINERTFDLFASERPKGTGRLWFFKISRPGSDSPLGTDIQGMKGLRENWEKLTKTKSPGRKHFQSFLNESHSHQGRFILDKRWRVITQTDSKEVEITHNGTVTSLGPGRREGADEDDTNAKPGTRDAAGKTAPLLGEYEISMTPETGNKRRWGYTLRRKGSNEAETIRSTKELAWRLGEIVKEAGVDFTAVGGGPSWSTCYRLKGMAQKGESIFGFNRDQWTITAKRGRETFVFSDRSRMGQATGRLILHNRLA